MDSERNWFEHILYEVEMYCFSYTFVPNSRLQQNMAIECRAIHIRNLIRFFYKDKKKLDKDEWHVSDFVTDTKGIRLVEDEKLFKDVKNYASRATGHLLRRHRLTHAYKIETMQCYEKAFPLIIDSVNDFIDEMDSIVRPEYRSFWEDQRIKDYVARVKEIMQDLCDGRK